MTMVQPARSATTIPHPASSSRSDAVAEAGTEASPPATGGRYVDALLTDMDRYIRPDLATDRARFLYQAVRRVMVRLMAESARHSAFTETGLYGAPDWSAMAPESALKLEGTLLDEEIAANDARVTRLATAPHTPPVTMEVVQGALRHLGYPDATVETLRVIIGGRSKQTILLRVAGCPGLPPDLVLRRDLLVGSLGTSVVNEFGLLQTLFAHGVEVPEVYRMQADRDVLGTPFLLLRAVPGAALGQITEAPQSPEKVLAAARALASVHRIPVAVTAPLLTHLGTPRTRDETAAEIAEWHSSWRAQARSPSPAMEGAFRFLAKHVHTVEERPCFVHGDYSFHNLLFEGDQLTAVLDWELAHIGHAAEDLGYIKQAVQSVVPWADFMAAYHAAGGPPLERAALRFYGLLGTVRLLMKICLARALFEDGKTDDILKADVAAFWMPRVIQKISLEMREIIDAGG
jgi:aminoglycoside phosphotransferase (APT) family kinase protein